MHHFIKDALTNKEIEKTPRISQRGILIMQSATGLKMPTKIQLATTIAQAMNEPRVHSKALKTFPTSMGTNRVQSSIE